MEKESYWISVWTLGGGGCRWKGSHTGLLYGLLGGGTRLKGSRTWFLYGLGGGAPGRWIDGSVGSVGSVGSIDPSSDRPIDLSIDLPI